MTLVFLFTLGIGQMWAADPKLSIANPDQNEYSQDGVYVTSPVVANAKMGNQTNQKCFYVTSTQTTASLNIFSKLTNIKSISFDMVRNTGGSSLGNAVSLYVSKGDAYTIPTSTDFSAKRNNSDNVTSLENVQAIGNNVANQVTNISVTFTSNVKAIEFRNVYSSGTYVRNLVVTYESGTLPDTYLKATMLTSANDAINMDVEPTGVENASITANTDVSKKAAISEKNYCKMDGTFTINLGTGKTFVAGDQIIVDVCASAVKKQVGITIDSKTINTYLANTIYSQLAYVVKTGDGIIGEQTATFTRSSSDTYIHSVSVLRAPAAATTYTLTLNSAGGSIASYDGWTLNEGVYTKSGITSGTSVALLALTKSGYRLNGWKDGDNADYTSPVTVTGNLTLTAQWAKEYAVSFAAGDHGTNTMDPAKYIAGETVELPDCGFVSDDANYVFDKWAISGVAGTTEGNPGDEFAMPAGAVTITAQWREIVNRTITLDANGGTIASYDGWDKEGNVYSKTVTEGTEVSLLAFTKSGLQLMFFRDGDDNEYSSSVTLNSNLNLKAIWGKEKEVELYYWEGKEGGAIERGGTAVSVDKDGNPTTGNADVNALVSPYYTIRVQGKYDYSNPYVKITTDESVKTGDKITFTGFINKNQQKDAAMLMKAGDKELFAETTSLPNIAYPAETPGSPEEREYTITTTGVDATALDLMRNSGHTGTNCFVTKLAITGTRIVEDMSPAATPSISVHPATASYTWKQTIQALTVTATVSDGGTRHYQWYKEAGETDTKVGTDAASYTPTESGTYYVVVTNKKTGYEDASATSDNAVVTIGTRPSYTVTYYDGSTPLGEESVLEEANPAEYAAKQAKSVYGVTGLYEFNGWYNNSDLTEAHKIANIAALSITANTPIYGQWTRIEAEDVNLVEYAETIAGNESTEDEFNAFKTWFSGKGYAYANLNALDNKEGNNGAYLGLKTKSDAAYIAFNVPANKRVTVKLGYMAQAAEMYINGTKDESQALTGGSTGSGNNYADWYYDVTEASTLKLKMTTGSTCVVKSITIGDIPTLNNDATLKSLKIAGTDVAGFAASTLNYYYELDYGFTSYPAVTYQKNDDNATVVYQDASDRSDDCSIVKVTAEDGVTVNQYIIHFYAAPKYGVELIKATHTGEHTADKAGYWKDDVTIDKNTQGGGKLGSADHYFGLTLGNEKTFKAGDLVVIKASNISSTVELFDKKTFSTDQADSLTYLNKGNFDSHSKMYTFTLTADADKLYLYRTKTANSQMNPTVDYIAVYRQMAPFIESFEIAGVEDFVIDQDLKTITASVANTFDVTALTPTVKYWANGTAKISPTVGEADFTDPVSYTVSSGYAEDATGDYAPVTYTVTITKVVPAETPDITTNPAGANYYEGATITALNVEASVTDGGTLSYQWQEQEGENWNDITNATSDSYTPTVSAIGTYKYRVVVTNTLTGHPAAQATSAVATIVIAEDPSCKAIGYNTTTNLATTTEVVIDATTGLKHKSSKSSTTTSTINRSISETTVTAIKLDGSSEYYDIYTTEKNIGSIAISMTSGGSDQIKYAVVFCTSAAFDANNVSGAMTLTGGNKNEPQVINTVDGDDIPLGTKCVRIMRQYGTYGSSSSNYLYYARVCLIEPAQEVSATVTAEPASATYCPSDAIAQLSYALSIEEGASAAYQWYKGSVAIENATSATYTPTEAGVYKCTASLTKTGRMPKNLTSADATIVINTATAITTAPANQRGAKDAQVTLSVVAVGEGLSYEWFTCTNQAGEGAVALDPAQTGTSINVTITENMHQWYKVAVHGACGDEFATALVEEWHEVAQADVTESQEWDWNKTSNAAAWSGVANIQLTGDDKTTDFVMANTSSTMPNNNNFHSDMLVVNGEYPARPTQDGGVFQGYAVKFHTTVPGKVTVVYRGTGNSANVNLVINDHEFGNEQDWHTKSLVVPAGNVVITEKAGGVLRIRSIEFKAAAKLDPDATEDATLGGYERDVTEGQYGTICLPNGGVMVGAAIFEVAYMTYQNNAPYKVFFDEVLSGEMVAGRPYIFMPNENAEKIAVFYTDNANADAGYYRGLHGTYNRIEGNDLYGKYIFYNNTIFMSENQANWLNANRAYIVLSEVQDYETPASAGRRRVSMGVNAPAIATGLEDVQGGNVQATKVLIDGQLYILRGEKMYDAKGQLVK